MKISDYLVVVPSVGSHTKLYLVLVEGNVDGGIIIHENRLLGSFNSKSRPQSHKITLMSSPMGLISTSAAKTVGFGAR